MCRHVIITKTTTGLNMNQRLIAQDRQLFQKCMDDNGQRKGLLDVRVVEAKDLLDNAHNFSSSDPYCRVMVYPHTVDTPKTKKGKTPTWNAKLPTMQANNVDVDILSIDITDARSQKRLGTASITTASCAAITGAVDSWYPVSPQGQIRLRTMVTLVGSTASTNGSTTVPISMPVTQPPGTLAPATKLAAPTSMGAPVDVPMAAAMVPDLPVTGSITSKMMAARANAQPLQPAAHAYALPQQPVAQAYAQPVQG
jgi:hypothetical protein